MTVGLEVELSILLPVLTVTATALVILVADWFVSGQDTRTPVALALVGLLTAGFLVWHAWGGPDLSGFTRQAIGPDGGVVTVGLLRGDGLALFVEATLVLSALVTVLLSTPYVRQRGIARAEYFVLLLFAVAGMMLLGLANDLIVLFLALETFSIALYVLAGMARGERLSQEAALKYFFLGAYSAGFLLYGVALVYAATGTTNMQALGRLVAVRGDHLPVLGYLGFGLLLVGLGFKIAMAPFHQWTPDVYQGAPTPVAAFMSAGTKVAAFAALIRVLWTAFAGASAVWVPLLGGLAVTTMLVGNLVALVQIDLKRMLGYSAVAQAGYILVAVLAGSPEGTSAALFYLLIYALMNLGAFAVLIAMGPVGPEGHAATNLNDLSGLAKRHPALALAMAIFLLSLTGLPPTAGFLGKWYILRAAVDAGLSGLAVAIVLNSVLSAFYYLRPVVLMYMAEPAETREIVVPAGSAVAVATIAVVIALAAALSAPLVSGARAAGNLAPSQAAGPAGEAGGEVQPGVFIAPPDLRKGQP